MNIRHIVLIIIQFACSLGLVLGQVPSNNIPKQGKRPVILADSAKTGPQDSSVVVPRIVSVLDSPTVAEKKTPKKNDSGLDTLVNYASTDSIVFDMKQKVLVLYKKAEMKYSDIELKADSIAIDFEGKTLYAAGLTDSTDQLTGLPDFKEKTQAIQAERIAFNYKTRKGKVAYARTKQDANFLLGEQAKIESQKESDENIIYIRNGAFTTCDAAEPHFFIRSRKLKILPNDRIISGPLMLVIAKFPLPIVLPFGFFPNKTGRSSGILLPKYGDDKERGFFLKDLAYYWAVNDYIGLKFNGDIYTRGGYRVGIIANYKVRNKYDGLLDVSYGLKKKGEKYDVANYYKSPSYFIRWNHSQVLTPSSKISANVNFGSSGFLRDNSYKIAEATTASLKSTVNFSTSILRKKMTLGVNADGDQNILSHKMNLTLPNINASVGRQTPFAKMFANKSEAFSLLSNLGISYTMNAQNRLSLPDSVLLTMIRHPMDSITLEEASGDTFITTRKSPLEYFNTGIVHSVPVSSKVTFAKLFTISPSFNYHEYEYFKRRNITYTEKIDTATGRRIAGETETSDYGFYTARDYSFKIDGTTNLYGFYSLKGKSEAMVRHTITPNINFSVKPDFSQEKFGVFAPVRIDTLGNTRLTNLFANAINGSPSAGEQRAMGFGLNNNLEMKYKPRVKKHKADSTNADSLALAIPDTIVAQIKGGGDPSKAVDPFKKITLIDNFSISSSYNFAADSFQLAPFNVAGRTNLFKNKLGIQSTATFDPYYKNEAGVSKGTRYLINTTGQLARLTTWTVNLTTSFSGGKGSNSKPKKEKSQEMLWLGSHYADPEIPWSLNLAANFRYSHNGTRKDTTLFISASGNVMLGKFWSINYTTGFDVISKKLTATTFGITRNLHCWEMGFQWTPLGPANLRSFLFTLNPIGAMLKDLKIQKRNDFRDRFN